MRKNQGKKLTTLLRHHYPTNGATLNSDLPQWWQLLVPWTWILYLSKHWLEDPSPSPCCICILELFWGMIGDQYIGRCMREAYIKEEGEEHRKVWRKEVSVTLSFLEGGGNKPNDSAFSIDSNIIRSLNCNYYDWGSFLPFTLIVKDLLSIANYSGAVSSASKTTASLR